MLALPLHRTALSAARATRTHRQPQSLHPPRSLWALAAAALVAAGCSGGSATPGGAAGGQTPPPPSVGVITVQAGSLGLSAELPGRLESSRVAQVRARV